MFEYYWQNVNFSIPLFYYNTIPYDFYLIIYILFCIIFAIRCYLKGKYELEDGSVPAFVVLLFSPIWVPLLLLFVLPNNWLEYQATQAVKNRKIKDDI